MENLKIGQKVYSILYGGRDGVIYKIEGEQRPETIQKLGGCGVMGGNAHIYIVFDNGSKSCVPESIIHGVQWRIYEEYVTENEVQAALQFATETEERKKQEVEAEKQRQDKERERIIKEFSSLTKIQDSKLGSYAVGAKNIKKELAQKFPGAIFSVASKSYSGGCSIDIRWTDGPSETEVEKITSKYEEGSFNGMEDIYEYDRSNVWPDIFGGAKYVHTSRIYSKDAHKIIAEQINVKISYKSYDGLEFEEDFDRRKFYETIKDHSFYKMPEPKKIESQIIQPVNKSSRPFKQANTQEATKKQLWALHCITRFDTRNWKISFNEADSLIKTANSGENIKNMVKEFIAC